MNTVAKIPVLDISTTELHWANTTPIQKMKKEFFRVLTLKKSHIAVKKRGQELMTSRKLAKGSLQSHILKSRATILVGGGHERLG